MPARSRQNQPNPFAALARSVRVETDRRLAKLLAARVKGATKFGKEVKEIASAVRELGLRGGKRLRPALVAVGLRAVSARASIEPAIDVGLALEMLHTYFLIHDDWMDGDVLRRGGPTVHKLLSQRLGSVPVGEKSAILAGDFAIGLGLEWLASARVPEGRVRQLLAAFAEMHNAAIFGQELDVAARRPDPELVYSLKTASYTVRGPLVMGAILGGGDAALLAALRRFSEPAGIAFQLRDDLLGAFGAPEATGKTRGADLRAGKYTALVKVGLERARGRERSFLQGVLGRAEASQQEVERALSILDACGAREGVEKRIGALTLAARRALARAKITKAGRLLLDGALEALAERPG